MAPYITLAALALAGSASARLSAAPAAPARALLAEQGGRCSDRDHPVAMSLSEEDLCLLHPGETVESCAGLDREGHANYCSSFDEAAHLISLGECFSPDEHGDLRININDNGDIECANAKVLRDRVGSSTRNTLKVTQAMVLQAKAKKRRADNAAIRADNAARFQGYTGGVIPWNELVAGRQISK